MQWSKVD